MAMWLAIQLTTSEVLELDMREKRKFQKLGSVHLKLPGIHSCIRIPPGSALAFITSVPQTEFTPQRSCCEDAVFLRKQFPPPYRAIRRESRYTAVCKPQRHSTLRCCAGFHAGNWK